MNKVTSTVRENVNLRFNFIRTKTTLFNQLILLANPPFRICPLLIRGKSVIPGIIT